MGILIYSPDQTAPVPRHVVLKLTCDGDHGLFPPGAVVFDDPSGFVAQHHAAVTSGWLETSDERGRVFLGPCCSGKRAS
jgi:hypothetical protein